MPVSPYNYTMNNPIGYIDPDGKYKVSIIDGRIFVTRLTIGEARGIIYGKIVPGWIGLYFSAGQDLLNDPSLGRSNWIDYLACFGGIEFMKYAFNSGMKSLFTWGMAGFQGSGFAPAELTEKEINPRIDGKLFNEMVNNTFKGIPMFLNKKIKIIENGKIKELEDGGETVWMINPEYINRKYGGNAELAYLQIYNMLKEARDKIELSERKNSSFTKEK